MSVIIIILLIFGHYIGQSYLVTEIQFQGMIAQIDNYILQLLMIFPSLELCLFPHQIYANTLYIHSKPSQFSAENIVMIANPLHSRE